MLLCQVLVVVLERCRRCDDANLRANVRCACVRGGLLDRHRDPDVRICGMAGVEQGGRTGAAWTYD